MSVTVATHSGPFHADDVLAWALIKEFHDSDAQLIRTRDKQRLAEADIVVDVGGTFDPEALRFDHHQASYTGPLSSAGMVLHWLEDSGKVAAPLAASLREALVHYVDDVDNGRVAPVASVPCFPRIVEALNHPATHHDEFDAAFLQAGELARAYVRGLVAGHVQEAAATHAVVEAMETAKRLGSNLILLDSYYRWKPIYFAHGGEDHPTEFVVFPSTDGTIRVVAIPPKLGDFDQKKSLPESWAGLTDAALEEVTGVPGSLFCHKNRFIAVFQDREAALTAMRRFDLTS